MFWLNTRFFFSWTVVCGMRLILSGLTVKCSAVSSLPPAFRGVSALYVWCLQCAHMAVSVEATGWCCSSPPYCVWQHVSRNSELTDRPCGWPLRSHDPLFPSSAGIILGVSGQALYPTEPSLQPVLTLAHFLARSSDTHFIFLKPHVLTHGIDIPVSWFWMWLCLPYLHCFRYTAALERS